MLKLIGSLLSPWARRVAVVLDEKGLEYQHEDFFPFGELPDAFRRKSPLGMIPVLDTEEGSIADSRAICHYLEARFPEVPLLPTQPFALARVLWLCEFAAAVFRHEGTIFFQRAVRGHLMKQEPDMAAVEAARQEIPPLLAHLEGELAGREFLCEERLTLADVTVASVLLNYLHAGERIDAADAPALAAYLDRLFARPSFARRIEADLAVLSGLSTVRA